MASDAAADRAYPYHSGWRVACCAVFFFGLLGAIGVTLLPAGYERVQLGQMPTGVAMMVLGVLGVPTLGMAFLSLAAGVRDAVRPPLLRVTATALLLPAGARGEPPQDEDGAPLSDQPPHPEVIPFAAIRRVKRDGPPFNQALEIAHDLSAEPLRIEQSLMRRADFDELCELLTRTLAAGSRLTELG